MEEYTVKVIVAAHKEYEMPSDEMYIPVHVGSVGKESIRGYQRDDEGENISSLNPYFCELTGLYWAWKNLNADYIGLVHYRRHFATKKKDGFENVLKYTELKPYLGKIKIFVPNKRRYYIESLYSHYAHTHYSEQLDETRNIISEKYPDYVKSYDKVIKQRHGYMFNMAIMERDLLDDYCSWLFDILFELENRIDISELDAFQRRFYGRISEIIFNVWLDKKIKCAEIKGKEIKEIRCIHMEKINWWKKGIAFLRAKYMGKKYEGSF